MVPPMADLAYARKAQSAAFVSEDGLLVIWVDSVLNIIERATIIEQELIKLVWTSADEPETMNNAPAPKGESQVERVDEIRGQDPETGRILVPRRPVHIFNSFLLSLTLWSVLISTGAAVPHIAAETHTDGFWPRISLVSMFPLQITFTWSFSQVLCGSIPQIFVPVCQWSGNSKYYSGKLPARQVWILIVIVFNGSGNMGLAAMRYRAHEYGLISAFLENVRWVIMLAVFLGGLSFHLASALSAHMFKIDIQWGAAAKEHERSHFWAEMPKIIKKFKYTMTFSFTFIVIMIVLAVAPFIPWDWHITDFVAILPMSIVVVSHILLPWR